jgi:hypothetical protein
MNMIDDMKIRASAVAKDLSVHLKSNQVVVRTYVEAAIYSRRNDMTCLISIAGFQHLRCECPGQPRSTYSQQSLDNLSKA